ncbi:hypothetical protein F2Q70_00003274 [Brassica cretica]|uniref:Uncharacterized protein n=1 Tax=Brassica cretica TaxID=69181 RepID=A0A8S9IS10_BRACR|nr:hypothetical protein F2Q70_00003274 [Brassica cretica]
MEQGGQIQNTQEAALGAEKKGNYQKGFLQNFQAAANGPPDELKGLDMMMQQLLQGHQVQAKALNQVTTNINTRMENMFTELSTKYHTVSNHIRRIDVQLVQTAGSAEERTEHPASSKATAPDEIAETPSVRVYVPKVPYPIPPKHLMDSISAEQLAGFWKIVRRIPKKISFAPAWEIQPLHMFFKNCRETHEEIKALITEALTPALKVLPKVDVHGKFSSPCSIAGVEFKEALCDSGSSVNLVSSAIVEELSIVDTEPSQVTRVRSKKFWMEILTLILKNSVGMQRAILTQDLKEKGEAAVKGLVSRVLKLSMSDCGACFGESPHAQPD